MDQFLNQYSFLISAVFLWLLLALLLLRRRQSMKRSATILGVVALFMLVFWILARPIQSDLTETVAARAQIGTGMPVLLEVQSPYCIACVRAKPIVDSLEAELAGRLKIIRLDVQSTAGSELGRQYDFRFTPTFILLDGTGVEISRWIGSIDPQKIRDLLGP
jgi:thiol-disulfide isomerase/thioredoxin